MLYITTAGIKTWHCETKKMFEYNNNTN